ncbi:alpha/beta-hydrolase [Lizonia empirigonia]|nr:alpha/beta-hydrolase [Lizonia empirigonia]
MSTKPTILFVPGAWHKASCFDPTLRALEAKGYPVATADHASVNPAPGLSTWDADMASIRSVLTPLVAAGKSVIVAAHSYGSLPSGEAIGPFLQRTRAAANQPGGVVHMMYIASFVLPAQMSLMDALGGKPPPWFSIAADGMSVRALNSGEIFYNDLPPADQQRHTAALEAHSYPVFSQKTSWMPCQELPCTYVFCTRDNAIPIARQRAMVEASGVRFGEVVIEAGHSPFLSTVDELVDGIVGVAERV